MRQVFVINLDKDTARLAACGAMLDRAGIAWARVPAVNGRALAPEALAAVYDAKANAARAKYPLVAPEIGCYLSHLRAWQAIVDADLPMAVVLEDDFTITGDLAGVIAALAQDHGDWDIAKLFSFRPDVRLMGARELTADVRIGFPYRVPSTTLGYAVRREAAIRLLQVSTPFFRPIDEDHKFFWEKDLRIALVQPQPLKVGLQDAAEGTVGDVRKTSARADRGAALARALRGVRYSLGYQLRLHLARLLGRGQ